MYDGIFEKLLAFREVPDVDAKPGLYAWYLRIKPGESNMKCAENFSQALKKIIEQLCYPDWTIQLQGDLSLNWTGQLNHNWYGHEKNPFTNTFQEILSQPVQREVFSHVLEATVPLLCAPLYIGVSKDLQARLQQHTQLIQNYHEQVAQFSPIDSEESLDNDRNFAQRIVEREIDPNHLVVGIIDVFQTSLSPETMQKAIETAEMLLNRIFYPILGRR